MSFERAYNPVIQFFDENGKPITGGTLSTFLAGTNTPVATFNDRGGHVENPVCMPLDNNGCAPDIWLNSGVAYKFIVRDSNGVEVFIKDYVRSQAAGGGGGGVVQPITFTFNNPTGADTTHTYDPAGENPDSLSFGSMKYMGATSKQTYQTWGPITGNASVKGQYIWKYDDGAFDDLLGTGFSDLYSWWRACVSNGAALHAFSVLYEGNWYDIVGSVNAGTYYSELDFKCRTTGNGFKIYADGPINPTITHLWYYGVSSSGIYPTLQDAVADEANLSVGDIFETNGFHTSGDGGAARYLVSNTGTANGMDIVSMATGKNAVLQIDDGTATPEQFGYNRWNQDDLTPVMNRMQTAKVRNIVLSPLESGDNFPYLMKTTFTPAPAIQITSCFNFNTGASGRIWFVPSSYGTDHTVMFQLTNRGFGIKDVVLFNRPWFTEGDKHNCVCFRMAISVNNNMWYEFDSLAIQGFDVGFLHESVTGQDSSALIWHCTFKKLQMSANNINVYLRGLQYLTRFENCFFSSDDSGARSIVLEETFTTEFNRCNFGIYNPAETVVDFKDYLVTGKAVDRRFSQAKFTNCNFEIESNDSHPLPTAAKGFFMRFDDHDEFTVEIDNCCFIITPLVRVNIYGCRPIKLGAKTRMKITNSSGPYADVNYTANEFYGWDYQKRMFDETKPPMKEVGSLIIQHCVGIIPPPNNQWGSEYLPVVKMDEMTCPQSDNDTDFLTNYPEAKDGVMLLNLDKANIETKVGNSIVQVTAPASGKVRIGDRIYDYVTIDGRKWITTNLRLWTMGTREWHFPDHEEYGFYYPVDSFTEVDALLPTGWRRPTNTDFNSLISQGYAALQATGQVAFPSATNSSGFSALPSYRWKKPNVPVTFDECFIWGTDQGTGYSALRIQDSAVSISGWSYADIASSSDPVYVPIRVCCDA